MTALREEEEEEEEEKTPPELCGEPASARHYPHRPSQVGMGGWISRAEQEVSGPRLARRSYVHQRARRRGLAEPSKGKESSGGCREEGEREDTHILAGGLE